MTFQEVVNIVLAGIAALGGGGFIVLGLSNYTGQLWARRYEERVKAEFQKQINEYQTHLDLLKETAIRYSDRQFEQYHKLWSSLYDLKLLADDLWERATPSRLTKFSRQLKATKTEIEKGALFIEDKHYGELMGIIKQFSDYRVGKEALISYRSEQDFDDGMVQEVIANNGEKLVKFEGLISAIKVDLKKQIGGK